MFLGKSKRDKDDRPRRRFRCGKLGARPESRIGFNSVSTRRIRIRELWTSESSLYVLFGQSFRAMPTMARSSSRRNPGTSSSGRLGIVGSRRFEHFDQNMGQRSEECLRRIDAGIAFDEADPYGHVALLRGVGRDVPHGPH